MLGHLRKPIDPVALANVLSRYAPAAAAPEAVSRGPSGIDESYLRLLVDSLGAAKVGHLISELPQHARPHRDRLAATARDDTDLAQMRAAAHALAGMAANLGLTALAELTGAIEDACRAGGATEAASLCDRLDATFEAALARLEALGPGKSCSTPDRA